MTENIVAVRWRNLPVKRLVTVHNFDFFLSISEDADYHYDGNTGTLLYCSVPIKEY